MVTGELSCFQTINERQGKMEEGEEVECVVRLHVAVKSCLTSANGRWSEGWTDMSALFLPIKPRPVIQSAGLLMSAESRLVR